MRLQAAHDPFVMMLLASQDSALGTKPARFGLQAALGVELGEFMVAIVRLLVSDVGQYGTSCEQHD